MTMTAGSKVRFTVEGIVNGGGHVEIGCKRFTQAEIGDVAQDLEVIAPPVTLAAGDLYRAETPHHEYGEHFYAAEADYYDDLRLWSLKNGTHAPTDWWRDQVGPLVKVGGQGQFTDKATDRNR